MMNNQEKKVYLVIQSTIFSDSQAFQTTLADWLSLSQILTSPVSYTLDDQQDEFAFSTGRIKQLLADVSLSEKNEKTLTILAEAGEFSLQFVNGKIKQSILLDFAIFDKYQAIIEDYVNQKMLENGLFAYIRDSQEYLAHNMQSVAERLSEDVDFPKDLPKMYDDNQEIIVDCSQLSGYDFYFKGLCFTSCWKMWVSRSYYHIIPKKAFTDIQQVEEVKELPQEIVRITLYKDLTAWQHPQNLHFQLLLREQLGFDQLEWENGVGVLREPLTEFMRLGKNTQMIQYQNSSLQPTQKSLARHFTTRVFNYETNQYLEGRRYGRLNNRAYFPWQDDTKKTMLAYWVLNPVYMLDQGVAAFDFYISQYLNLQVKDEETKDYQAILRFYLPQKLLSGLPLERLQEKLRAKDVAIKQKEAPKQLLQVETLSGPLQVEFVNVEELVLSNTEG